MSREDQRLTNNDGSGRNDIAATGVETGDGGVSPHEGAGWSWNDGLDSLLNFGLGVFQTSKATDSGGGTNSPSTDPGRFNPPKTNSSNTVVYILAGFVVLVIMFFIMRKA
ncbi:MAG: LPXTG cell wall anchor domain-containing protein [Owenweeksia sp.]